MRLATLTLALAGLLSVGSTFAVAGEQPTNVPTASLLTTATDQAVVTPVSRYVYRPAPAWRGYYYGRPYTTYRPRYYWYAPQYYDDRVYPVYPYRTYYYDPNGFRFEYYGPRGRSFEFEF
jgi:hypothetical protein